jgi:alpha-tubulin suppressor-like RCC1 family protein
MKTNSYRRRQPTEIVQSLSNNIVPSSRENKRRVLDLAIILPSLQTSPVPDSRLKSPVAVSSLSRVVAISAGGQHTVAVKADGTVWSWGNGLYGQMGNNTTNRSNLTPVQVSGLRGVRSVAAGHHHSVALKSNGTVWAWGQNDNGQLGNGTTTAALTPVQVPGMSGVSQILAGNYHTIALKSDGTVWAWGLNNDPQLGNGSTFNSSTPTQVNGLDLCSVNGS